MANGLNIPVYQLPICYNKCTEWNSSEEGYLTTFYLLPCNRLQASTYLFFLSFSLSKPLTFYPPPECSLGLLHQYTSPCLFHSITEHLTFPHSSLLLFSVPSQLFSLYNYSLSLVMRLNQRSSDYLFHLGIIILLPIPLQT